MMNYEEFKQEVTETIKDYLPERYADADVSIHEVLKNNDQHLDGLNIKTDESNMIPTIYLNSFFADYEAGRPMDEILEQIADIYENNVVSEQIDVSNITDIDKVKDKIVARVVNAEQNAELLEGRPYTMMADDLAVTYHVNLSENGEGLMSTAVTNALADTYGLDADGLHEIAMKNMPENNKTTFRGMTEVLMEMMGGEMPPGLEMPDGKEQMYVLSNETKMNGAVAMMDTQTMDQIAEKLEGDYYILPSSIHEVLVVPMDAGMDREMLENMVREVNQTQVAPADRLSDHVYAYDAEAHEVMRADRYEERHNEAARDEVVADMPKEEFDKAAKEEKAPEQEKPADEKKSPEKSEKAAEKKPAKKEQERPSLKARLDEKKAEAAKKEHKAPTKDINKNKDNSL